MFDKVSTGIGQFGSSIVKCGHNDFFALFAEKNEKTYSFSK